MRTQRLLEFGEKSKAQLFVNRQQMNGKQEVHNPCKDDQGELTDLDDEGV